MGGAQVVIRNNLITHNFADYLGGGIELDHPISPPPIVESNVFYSNEARIRGGAIETHANTNTIIRNNTIVRNFGHGVGFVSDSCTVENNIIADTQAGFQTGAPIFCSPANSLIRCNNLWNNVGGDTICGIDNGGNFSADPQFCLNDSLDFTIHSDSPWAPGNHPSGTPCGLIGALPMACGDIPTSIRNYRPRTAPLLFQNYPNPFNPTTVIHYRLQRSEHVRLEIFDVRGRRVRTLVNEVNSAGIHEARWNASDDSGIHVPSGVYFYRIETGGVTKTKKMVLLK